MKITEKIKKFAQSDEERNTVIMRGVKYKSVKNGWVPILNEPTVSLIDYGKTER